MRTSTKPTSVLSFWQRLHDFQFIDPKDGYSQEIVFVAIALLSSFTLVSLASFSPFDPSPYNYSFPPREAQNLCGQVGAYLAGYLIYNLGGLAFILPLPGLWMSLQNLKGQPKAFGKSRLAGWFLACICLMTGGQQWGKELSFEGFAYLPGGAVGFYLHKYVSQSLGLVGFYLLLLALSLFASLLIHRQMVIRPLYRRLRGIVQGIFSKSTWSFKKTSKRQAPELSIHREKSVVPTEPLPGPEEPALFTALPIATAEPLPIPLVPRDSFLETSPAQDLSRGPWEEEVLDASNQNYQPPPASLFKSSSAPLIMSEEQKREFEQTAESLVKSFAEFGIGGEVIAIQPGPVVAVYEFQPHAGTKLAKVTGLLDDIALALKVDSIFIHPISGKRALGVQVPNKKRDTVFLGDLVQTPAFRDAKSPLTFALGKALNGEPICCDLASMPHLLTAGQTGSGKSVAVNALLCSLILKASPEQVRMILVDPKILELKIYEGIPHLLMPVITEPLKASLALKWACQEMDRRYQLMESAMVRHISGFNQYWEQANSATRDALREKFGDHHHIGKLPYIVIVIDELADLMLMASKDVENSIQRLAQKARASGIHLVLATQRPSVDVITGVIKANLPCRIAFKVFSRIDSRTILDSMGAERLLGKGDMLFLRPGSTRLERIQGAFLSDEEVVSMVDDLKKTRASSYDEHAMGWIDEEFQKQGGSGTDGDMQAEAPGQSDPKWNEAFLIAQRQGAISASYLQRMLKIGYNRAARIVEAMEAQGLVARADGSKPRAWTGPQS